MKKLSVKIFKENNYIGKALYVHIFPVQLKGRKDRFIVELLNLNLFFNETLLKNEVLSLQINLTENQFDVANIILDEPIVSSARIRFTVKVDKNMCNYWESYSLFMYDIFAKWINDIKLDWRDLSNESEKKSWIRACGRNTDITRNTLSRKSYHIDLKEINSVIDFYCLIGESFFGYKGYMGGDGNAFSDCLYLSVRNSEIQKFQIIFKNFSLIREQCKNDIDSVNEIRNFIIRNFEDNNFNIVLEN